MSPKEIRKTVGISTSGINTKSFTVMLNKVWLPRKELNSITRHFYEENKKSYGKTFIIRKDLVSDKYGVFIKERRRETNKIIYKL